jgi:hypothetical protein
MTDTPLWSPSLFDRFDALSGRDPAMRDRVTAYDAECAALEDPDEDADTDKDADSELDCESSRRQRRERHGRHPNTRA